LTIKACGKL